MKNSKSLYLMAATFTLICMSSGCGSSATQTQSDTISPQNVSLGAASLQGDWQSPCANLDPAGFISGAASTDGSISFRGNRVSSDFAFYSDSKCKKVLFREHQQGAYVLSAAPDSKSGAVAIDYNISEENVTYFDQKWIDGVVADTKGSSTCDLSKYHFKVGVSQDVSDQEWCMHQESIGQERYSVIKAEGNHLFMGTSGDGSGDGDYSDNRSTKLGTDFLIRK